MIAVPGVRRAGVGMAAGTVLSRATGLLRTAALAAALGVTSLADAYNIANTVPTILLILVTGGTLSAVLIPLLVEHDDLDERRQRADSLSALVLAVTVGAAFLAVLVSPLLARMFALGIEDSAVRVEFTSTTTLLLVLFAPQVVAYGVSVHAVAVLNAAGRLALGSFASVATNLVTIAGIGLYVSQRDDGATGGTRALVILGVTTTAGVWAMTAIQVWGARRVLPGTRLLPRLRLDDTTKRLLRLGRWTLLYVVANQVGLAVVLTVAASSPGGASAYQWAFAMMQLPYAVIAVSVLSAAYPRISRAARTDPADYASLVSSAMRLLLLLLLPAAVLLVVLAAPLTQLLLGYGAVDEAGLRLVTVGVAAFGLALLPFTAFQLLTRASFARGDTRAPALVNVAVNVVNVAGALLALTVSEQSPERMLALLVGAYGTSYAVGCVLLGAQQNRQVRGMLAGTLGTAVRLLIPAGAVTGVALGLVTLLPRAGLSAEAAPDAALTLVVVVVLSGAAYLAAARVCVPAELARVTGRKAPPTPVNRTQT